MHSSLQVENNCHNQGFTSVVQIWKRHMAENAGSIPEEKMARMTLQLIPTSPRAGIVFLHVCRDHAVKKPWSRRNQSQGLPFGLPDIDSDFIVVWFIRCCGSNRSHKFGHETEDCLFLLEKGSYNDRQWIEFSPLTTLLCNFGTADCLLQEAIASSWFVGKLFQQVRDSQLLLHRTDTRSCCPSQVLLFRWICALCWLCHNSWCVVLSVTELQHKSVLTSSAWTVPATATKLGKPLKLSPEERHDPLCGGASWECLQAVGKQRTSGSLGSPSCDLGAMCDQGRTIATKLMSVAIKHERYVLKGKGTEGKLSKTFQCTGFPAFGKLFRWKWKFSERYPERNFLPCFVPDSLPVMLYRGVLQEYTCWTPASQVVLQRVPMQKGFHHGQPLC